MSLSRIKQISIGAIIVVAVLISFNVDPVPQDLQYHQFADNRTLLGVANGLNVFSSLLFAVIGLYCLIISYRCRLQTHLPMFINSYYLFYLGMICIGLGSAFYHWNPNNETLMWDRLSMTISFMSLLSFVISRHINHPFGYMMLWPLILFGMSSVFYWIYTEASGQGDLRWYGLVQFLPMLLIPVILVLFPTKLYRQNYMWLIIGIYGLAKIAELMDVEIMTFTQMFSGHSLKHLLSALTGLILMLAVVPEKESANEIKR